MSDLPDPDRLIGADGGSEGPDAAGSSAGILDPRLLEALKQASSLELYQLSATIERLMSDPRRILEVRKELNLGQTVQFVSRPDGRFKTARVVVLKDRQVVVQDSRHKRWSLPYVAIVPSQSQQRPKHDSPPARNRPTRDDFRRGERVSFVDRYLQNQVGIIVRVNQKTASIDTEDGQTWRVSFALLNHVHDV